MKRHIPAAAVDRLFETIDRTLVAPLRARLDAHDAEITELRERASTAERAVRDLAESLEPRVVALEEAVFGNDEPADRCVHSEHQFERRLERLSDELRERTDTLGAETGAAAGALADLADRTARLEASAGAQPEVP